MPLETTGVCSRVEVCPSIAAAWVLAKGDGIVPLVGARNRDRLDESLGALDVELRPSDLQQIERSVPPGTAAGTRYNAYLMGQLDSEKAA